MTAESALSAFSRVEFHSVFDLQQIWMDRPAGHLPLHQSALGRFTDSLQRSHTLPAGTNPLGLCFVGPAGAGKTHLLGEIRREAAQQKANFILSDLTDVREFWPLLTMHYLQSLRKPMNGVPQLQRILEVLLAKTNREPDVAAVLNRIRSLPRAELASFANDVVSYLRPVYRDNFTNRLRVFRALLYLESDDFDLSERAYSFLQGIEQIDDESKKIFLGGPNSARRVAVDIAWFLSLCGPTVLTFDQLDPFVAQNNLAEMEVTSSIRLMEALHVLSDFVNGIMSIRHDFARTLIVVACIDSTWNVLQKRSVASFEGRFEEVETLQPIRDPGTPVELVCRRLEQGYSLSGFTPPYRSWPFAPAFFSSLPAGLTPREILNRCEQHRLACVRAGVVRELTDYAAGKTQLQAPAPNPQLDDRFAKESALVDISRLLNEECEDTLGELLGEAAQIFSRELTVEPNISVAVDHDFHESKRCQSLHLRLRRIFHGEGDREEHVCVRILQKTNAKSFQARLTAALTTSGMSEQLDGRRLFLLRNSPAPSGKVTAEIMQRAHACGAEFISLSAEDVRTLAAVIALSKRGEPLFETWLVRNLPLSKSTLFRTLVPGWLPPQSVVVPASANIRQKPGFRTQVFLGTKLEGEAPGDPVFMPLVDLTRHVILRAGSGGGKTVFIKRLVEEAALCGISSIVIDTAKDLSMLGDCWQKAPPGWTESDARLAAEYHRTVEVQIWTPGHGGGRPVRLAPLPNLSGPFEEEYDREQAVEIALAGLLPLAVQKKSPTVEKAILKKVLAWLTRQPLHAANELERLVGALRDLPAETFQGYQNERKLAAGMADRIQATLVGDSLYGGHGEDLDPAVLFGVGAPRPRVSILSLFAMADVPAQARFIGQLGSLLFNWIRRNPAPAGSPARGLLVLDEAAPFLPRNNAESKPALMLLAKQARKYGLGLIVATQNPMDLDYNAPANFATQLFGTANAPQVVRFIQEAMEQRGLSDMNPGQLKPGQFFCATPSLERPVRLQGSMCLSAHPHNTQLSDDEILEKARGAAAAASVLT